MTASRSSKIARMRALRKSHVSFSPAASSMLKRMPALVGAAKRAHTSACFHGAGSVNSQLHAGRATRKYPPTMSHGKLAAVIAIR